MKESLAEILSDPDILPLRSHAALDGFGRTLIVAPHPDDESLGCGGLIALLRRQDIPVNVLFVSDGTGSHPNSEVYPPRRLQALREREAVAAMRQLGVSWQALFFMRLKDRFVPMPGQAGFEEAAHRLYHQLKHHSPNTILLPWRRDPHGDHEATWHLIHTALRSIPASPRLIEYPIWGWMHMPRNGALQEIEQTAWRLDIRAVLPCKKAAIAAHRSQLTDMIEDDPNGFRITPDIRAHFERPWELYVEACP